MRPGQAGDHEEDQDQREHGPHAQAGEEGDGQEGREQAGGGAQVGAAGDEHHEQKDGGGGAQDVAQAQALAIRLGEDLGHEEGGGDLHELAGLELEGAQQDPAPGARDHGTEEDHVGEDAHAQDVEKHGPVGQPAVVDEQGQDETEEPGPHQVELLHVKAVQPSRVGGGIDRRHPDRGEEEGRA